MTLDTTNSTTFPMTRVSMSGINFISTPSTDAEGEETANATSTPTSRAVDSACVYYNDLLTAGRSPDTALRAACTRAYETGKGGAYAPRITADPSPPLALLASQDHGVNNENLDPDDPEARVLHTLGNASASAETGYDGAWKLD